MTEATTTPAEEAPTVIVPYYTHDGVNLITVGTCVQGQEDQQHVDAGCTLVRGSPPGWPGPERPGYDFLWNLEQQGWVQRAKPLAEIEAEARARRDKLLADTDWLVARAYELAEPVPPEWAAYRKALRDITEQEGFPSAVDWPAPPG